MGLLGLVVKKLAGAGLKPAQVSATLIAQKPKVAPYIENMRQNLAAGLGLRPGLVNLAATTSEGLGFTGRGEGMAAMAHRCFITGLTTILNQRDYRYGYSRLQFPDPPQGRIPTPDPRARC